MSKLILSTVFLIVAYFTSMGATYQVATVTQLETAIDNVIPGDIIELADGTWTDVNILIDADGSAANPITIRAEHPGQVTFSGVTRIRISGDYLVVSGLIFENCTATGTNLIEFRRTTGDEANHSRLTDCIVRNCNPASTSVDYKWVGLYGTYNEVDHCHFENKNHQGPTLVVWTKNSADYHHIHHNYFGPSPEGTGNGWETIRVGTSSLAQNDGFNTIEHNYFEGRDGEIEIISGKSSNCTYRYNIFEACKGGLTLRHGTDCTVDGNIFLGEGKSGTYGVRVIDRDHTVINNYFEGLNDGGSSYRHPLVLMGGESNAAASGYQLNINNTIAYNTVVNCTKGIMIDPDSDHDVPPDDCTIANNVIDISGAPPVVHGSTPTNTTYISNYFYRSDGSVNVPASGYLDVDPQLSIPAGDSLYRPAAASPIVGAAATGYSIEVQDFEGQPRPSTPTVGCDELSNSPTIDRGIYGPTWLVPNPPAGGPVSGVVSVLLEAEDAIVGSNWSTQTDPLACSGEYVLPPNGHSAGSAPTSSDDRVTFTFSLVEAGTYKVFARVATTGGSDDSFWVRANGGPWIRWNTINGPNYDPGFQWSQVGEWDGTSPTADPVTFDLLAGSNTVDFAWREDDAKLDKIFVTNHDLSVLNLVQNNSLEADLSLRYAIREACPLDTIYFADSTDLVAFPSDATPIDISIPLTIVGNGTTNTVLDGLGLHQLLINNSASLSLRHLSLANSFSNTDGGALLNNGTLWLYDVIFDGNLESNIPKALTNYGTIHIVTGSQVEVKE